MAINETPDAPRVSPAFLSILRLPGSNNLVVGEKQIHIGVSKQSIDEKMSEEGIEELFLVKLRYVDTHEQLNFFVDQNGDIRFWDDSNSTNVKRLKNLGYDNLKTLLHDMETAALANEHLTTLLQEQDKQPTEGGSPGGLSTLVESFRNRIGI